MAPSGDEGDSESSGCATEEGWDNLEEDAMKAFDAKLDALLANSAEAIQVCTSSTRVPVLSSLAESAGTQPATMSAVNLCDCSATAATAGATADAESAGALQAETLPAVNLFDCSATAGATADAESGGALQAESLPAAITTPVANRDLGLPLPRATPTLLREVGIAAGDLSQMLQAVAHEPYRPEDHILSLEEMWGGSEEEGGADIVGSGVPVPSPNGTISPVASPMRFRGQGVEGTGKREADQFDANVFQPENDFSLRLLDPQASIAALQKESAEERLRKILAGQFAPEVLDKLSFSELDAIADDCQRAVETLRYIISRQRTLAAAEQGHCRQP